MIMPIYQQPKISNLYDLSLLLDLPEDEIIYVANNSKRFYSPNPLKNVKDRQTYKIQEPLKKIHKSILKNILNYVIFPDYLHGGIKGTDYKNEAKSHLGCKIIIHEDISHFFDNITKVQVFDIWNNFFAFSEDISRVLTNLTTLNNHLPQGSSTSMHLSNLVFWKNESKIYEKFINAGFIYTRYVDDIHVTSKRHHSKDEITGIIQTIIGFFKQYGFKINRSKHKVYTNKNNLSIHNINLMNRTVNIPAKIRKEIKAGIKQLEDEVNTGIDNKMFLKRQSNLFGRIQVYKDLCPWAVKYELRLLTINRKINNREIQ